MWLWLVVCWCHSLVYNVVAGRHFLPDEEALEGIMPLTHSRTHSCTLSLTPFYCRRQASSPDEEALVEGAALLGFRLVARTADTTEVELDGTRHRYKVGGCCPAGCCPRNLFATHHIIVVVVSPSVLGLLVSNGSVLPWWLLPGAVSCSAERCNVCFFYGFIHRLF